MATRSGKQASTKATSVDGQNSSAAKVKFSDKTAIVVDNGLFVHAVLKLAESFGRVLYWTPSVNAFPKSNLALPGTGLDGIERIIDFWDYKDQADLFVFPDVMFGDMQEELISQGKRVFGSRKGEALELQRWRCKQLLRKLGMPVAQSRLIYGVAALREFLQTHPGHWWIKTSRYRGDFETFDSEDYDDVKPRIDELEYSLGYKGQIYPFVVEANIPAIIELGYDGPAINGQFPTVATMALEEKDLGAVGIAKDYDQLPEVLKWVNEKIAPTLKQYGYCGLFSTEVRCVDKETLEELMCAEENDELICTPLDEIQIVPGTNLAAFFTDPCCRFASPPSELYIEWFSNWPEIMWHGANGKLVTPEPIAKYGVEIMLHSSWADKSWQPVRFPEEIRQFVKLRNHCKIEGVDCAVPQSVGLPEIGAVIGLAGDLQEAIQLALERAHKITGYFIEPRNEAIPKAITKIQRAQENGIDFCDDPLPTPDDLETLQQEAVEAAEGA